MIILYSLLLLLIEKFRLGILNYNKGPFKYYVSKEVGGRGQMLMFADKAGGWGWPNAKISKK
jgi:hypothetical protein